MKLSLRDRVQLAQRLVETLDDEVEENAEAVWFAEAERRLEELRSGKLKASNRMKPFELRASSQAVRVIFHPELGKSASADDCQ